MEGRRAIQSGLQHSGEYVLPPAIAYVNQQPEVMGLAASQMFTVCADSECTAEEVQAAGTHPLLSRSLQSCPSACSGAGLCDIGTGKCLCDTGFQGADCSSVCDGDSCVATEPVAQSPSPLDQKSMSARQSSCVTLTLLLVCALSFCAMM